MTAKYKHEDYIVPVSGNKSKSVMDLNVDELRNEICRCYDILEAIDGNKISLFKAIGQWRNGE